MKAYKIIVLDELDNVLHRMKSEMSYEDVLEFATRCGLVSHQDRKKLDQQNVDIVHDLIL